LRGNRDCVKRPQIQGKHSYGPTRLLVFGSGCEIAKSVIRKKEAERGVALMLVKGEGKELEVDEGELTFVGNRGEQSGGH